MSEKQAVPAPPASNLPPDDLRRKLTSASPDSGENVRHIGLVGDTYTILLTGKETAGQFCLIDMHIPPGGGPPPHRHDFEETFSVLEGELEATFRGTRVLVRAGDTVHIPANAPHQFRNSSTKAVRLMCSKRKCRRLLQSTGPKCCRRREGTFRLRTIEDDVLTANVLVSPSTKPQCMSRRCGCGITPRKSLAPDPLVCL